MPFDFSETQETLRLTFASDNYVAGAFWRDVPVGKLFEALNMHQQFDKATLIDIRPAPEPTTDFRFTDELGSIYDEDDLPGVLPELRKHNRRQLKRDPIFGMTSESRRAHKKADHPGLDVRAVQYARAMSGAKCGHSSEYRNDAKGAVLSETITVPGKKTPERRAYAVQLANLFEIPNWDWVEPPVTSH